MDIIDISLSKIDVLQPKPIDNNFVFDITYDSNPFIIKCCGIMKPKIEEKLLNITNKNDLLNLHKIYNRIIEIIFNNQTKWFENNFTQNELKDMFIDIFIPNIELNCLDMRCNMVSKVELKNEDTIIPCFNFNNIIFDGKKFYISLDLEDYQIINNVESTTNTKNTILSDNNEKKDTREDDVEDEDEEEEEEVNNNEIVDEPEKEDLTTNDNIEYDEVELDTNNLEVLDLEVNEDDIYLIYKLIQNNIYKNMNENLRNIFESKNIDISKIDINELIYDSDDSDEEDQDSNIGKDDFETNFNKLL